MKKIVLFSHLLLVGVALFAQNNVGIGTINPDASSLLDLTSTSKGVLVPRLTTAQRLAILSPATGLLVYDIDVPCFYYFDASWKSLCNGGPVGNTGATGVQGNTGAAGAQGIQGPTGAKGIDGVTGATGAQGVQGVTGAQGATGVQGNQGATGAQGVQGISGATGAQGIQGATGAQGVTGSTGVDGATGLQGVQGVTGSTGADGATGSTGAQGNQGATGAQGATGSDGATGATGAQGLQGNTGADGSTGATGAQGVQGITGSTGVDGATGAQGIQGVTGAQGVQGVTGSTGADGATGAQGIQGPIGAQGLQGNTGANGIQGTTGATGPTWNITTLNYNTNGNVVLTTDQPATFTTTRKAWLLDGNGGTNPPTEFIGTTDAQPWIMKTTNAERARILANGNFGVGELNPVDKLQISNGNTRIGEVVSTVGAAGPGRALIFSGANSFGAGFDSDNSDAMFFQRWNVSNDVSELRLNIGDNNGPSGIDQLVIGNNQTGIWFPKVFIRSDGKTTISRDGIGECCGNDATLVLAENTTVSGRVASVSFHNGSQYQGQVSLVADNTGLGIVAGRLRMSSSGLAGTDPLGLQLTGGLFYGNQDSRTETRANAGLQGNGGAQSGFYEFNQPTGGTSATYNYPAGYLGNTWWHMIDTRHSNTGNNYAMQIAGNFFDQAFWVRKTNNNAAQTWKRMMTNGAFTEYSANTGGVTGTVTTNMINVADGFCFMSGHSGIYNGGGEVCRVRQVAGVWQLQATRNSGTGVTCYSSCIAF